MVEISGICFVLEFVVCDIHIEKPPRGVIIWVEDWRCMIGFGMGCGPKGSDLCGGLLGHNGGRC